MSDALPSHPVHGTAIAIDGRGVLIAGPAGSGKTTLGLALIRRARSGGLSSGLIADDRVIIEDVDGQLVARCPAPLRGRIEMRGFGIADASDIAIDRAVLALHVHLVPPESAVRFADGETDRLGGHDLPCLRLPQGPSASAPGAVFAALGLPVWL